NPGVRGALRVPFQYQYHPAHRPRRPLALAYGSRSLDMNDVNPFADVDTGLRDAFGRPYVPAVSPRLKLVLALIFAAVAVLGASGAYLSSVRLLEFVSGQTYTKPFKYWMLIGHV